ncbi:MAG: transposase [Gammaproteobacteria bacterium]|nr:transposase [Gammaproteobacteria bacterium]
MEINVTTVGLDLAKSSFQVFCADESGRCLEQKQLRRGQVLDYFKQLSPCMVAMETCSGANWWCRKLRELGHDARLIPAVYAKAYLRGQTNDPADARAICEAAQRPDMRFAPLKSEEASWVLSAHRSRRQLMK